MQRINKLELYVASMATGLFSFNTAGQQTWFFFWGSLLHTYNVFNRGAKDHNVRAMPPQTQQVAFKSHKLNSVISEMQVNITDNS